MRKVQYLLKIIESFAFLGLAFILLTACGNQQTLYEQAIHASSTQKHQQTQPAKTDDSLLPFTGKKQMVMGNLDSLRRAAWSHIQLQNKDENFGKRIRLTYNPVGWHNYKFYTGNGNKKAWLMSRGHLVGYQFCGLNNEPRNLVPETVWFNAGSYTGTDKRNQASMLYYEDRLDNWLSIHPNFWLDYKVTPIYQANELLPRQIALQYVGLDAKGRPIEISIGGKETHDKSGIAHVILDNVSPNATINYATGTATNTVKNSQ